MTDELKPTDVGWMVAQGHYPDFVFYGPFAREQYAADFSHQIDLCLGSSTSSWCPIEQARSLIHPETTEYMDGVRDNGLSRELSGPQDWTTTDPMSWRFHVPEELRSKWTLYPLDLLKPLYRWASGLAEKSENLRDR